MGSAMVLMVASVLGAEDVTLVQYSADWCHYCQTMKPTMAKLKGDGYPLRTIDVDANKELIRQHRVRALPTFILMKGDREIDRLEGEVSYGQLTRLFDKAGYRKPQTAPPSQPKSGLLGKALAQFTQQTASGERSKQPPLGNSPLASKGSAERARPTAPIASVSQSLHRSSRPMVPRSPCARRICRTSNGHWCGNPIRRHGNMHETLKFPIASHT